MRTTLRLLSVVVIGFLTSSSRGAITYVDAVPNTTGSDGNTMLDVGGVPTLISIGSGGNVASVGGNNGQWFARTDQNVNGTYIFETDTTSSAAETTDPLITTIPNLTPGTYNLYAMFWQVTGDATNARWDIEVRVGNSGEYTYYERFNTPETVVDASLGTVSFANIEPSVVLVSGTNSLHVASLGPFEITGSSVDIYINGPDIVPPPNPNLTDNQGQRTWYDGVGYELAAPPAVPGDFDGDGDVDGADFVVWQTNFPTAEGATLADGDADGDGDVDGADFVVWQTNFPTSPGPGVVSIPEPSALTLTLCGLAGLAALVLRQKRCQARMALPASFW